MWLGHCATGARTREVYPADSSGPRAWTTRPPLSLGPHPPRAPLTAPHRQPPPAPNLRGPSAKSRLPRAGAPHRAPRPPRGLCTPFAPFSPLPAPTGTDPRPDSLQIAMLYFSGQRMAPNPSPSHALAPLLRERTLLRELTLHDRQQPRCRGNARHKTETSCVKRNAFCQWEVGGGWARGLRLCAPQPATTAPRRRSLLLHACIRGLQKEHRLGADPQTDPTPKLLPCRCIVQLIRWWGDYFRKVHDR